jgi:hypothetical protein
MRTGIRPGHANGHESPLQQTEARAAASRRGSIMFDLMQGHEEPADPTLRKAAATRPRMALRTAARVGRIGRPVIRVGRGRVRCG